MFDMVTDVLNDELPYQYNPRVTIWFTKHGFGHFVTSIGLDYPPDFGLPAVAKGVLGRVLKCQWLLTKFCL